MNCDNTTSSEIFKFMHEVYKKTLAYELESVKINEDGTTTHLHSDRFIEEHPDRAKKPEYTDEEEVELGRLLYEIAKRF